MALKRPCCKSRCKRNLTLKTVMTLVVTFWSLSKNSQDSLSLAISWKAAVSKPLYFLSFCNPCGLGCGACRTLPWWWMRENPRMMDQSPHHHHHRHQTVHQAVVVGKLLGLSKVARFLSKGKTAHWNLLFICPHHSLASGIQVCRQAWLQILGIGKERILRCKRNFKGTDGRSLGSLAPFSQYVF